MKKLIGMILLSLLLGACTFPDSEEESSSSSALIPVDVVSVIDGDTIKIDFEGKTQTVRYLLVDTPETNHPTIGKQPLGAEATAENKRIIDSGEVSIEFDEGGRYDDYDRLLAYIYVDGESVQEQMLASGLARVAYIYPPNTRYVEEFKEVEEQAKDKEIGIWKYENYATDRGFNAAAYGSTAPSSSQSYEKKCTIKGNISRSGSKIYHMPGQSSYEQTNPEEWFCTEQEAQDAGFRSTGS